MKPKAEADDARKRIIATRDPKRKLKIFDAMSPAAMRIYKAQSYRNTRLEGRVHVQVPTETWEPFKLGFDAVRDEIRHARAMLQDPSPVRRGPIIAALDRATVAGSRLEQRVRVLAGRDERERELQIAIGGTGPVLREPTTLERILSSAFDCWAWDRNAATLRDRLDMNPDKWDLPTGTKWLRVTPTHLIAIPPKGKRQKWTWGHVVRVARGF